MIPHGDFNTLIHRESIILQKKNTTLSIHIPSNITLHDSDYSITLSLIDSELCRTKRKLRSLHAMLISKTDFVDAAGDDSHVAKMRLKSE
jgi:hypothetical protein